MELISICTLADRRQTFKNPKPALLDRLRESGPVPGDENGVKKRSGGGDESVKKKKRVDKNVSVGKDQHHYPYQYRWVTMADDDWTQVDMDKLADGLQKLGEDDLLQVVQMVHDNKSADSYTKNDVERQFFFFSFLSRS